MYCYPTPTQPTAAFRPDHTRQGSYHDSVSVFVHLTDRLVGKALGWAHDRVIQRAMLPHGGQIFLNPAACTSAEDQWETQHCCSTIRGWGISNRHSPSNLPDIKWFPRPSPPRSPPRPPPPTLSRQTSKMSTGDEPAVTIHDLAELVEDLQAKERTNIAYLLSNSQTFARAMTDMTNESRDIFYRPTMPKGQHLHQCLRE